MGRHSQSESQHDVTPTHREARRRPASRTAPTPTPGTAPGTAQSVTAQGAAPTSSTGTTPRTTSGAASNASHAQTWHRRILVGFLFLSLLGTAFGLFRLWPGNTQPQVSDAFYTTFSLGHDQVNGTVVAQRPGACSSQQAGTLFATSPREEPDAEATCTWYITEVTSGDAAGQRTLLINAHQPGDPVLEEGDRIRLYVMPSDASEVHYSFADYQRSNTLFLWGGIVAVAMVALALWRGVRALMGLAMAMCVVALFTMPALLAGFSPTGVALTSGSLMLFFAVFFVHGMNWKSASALGGTLVALGMGAWLAQVAISQNHLRGLGEDANLQIILYLPEVSVSGIMLCGFIIGSLGVLNDVTVAQASTVNELAELDPDATPLRLFIGAMKVGRDHIASMVYTLVLTYTGASLPLLLLLSVADRPLSQTLTSDIMSTELLRSGVGTLALTLAVPITTFIAAWTVPDRSAPRKADSAAPNKRRTVGHHH